MHKEWEFQLKMGTFKLLAHWPTLLSTYLLVKPTTQFVKAFLVRKVRIVFSRTQCGESKNLLSQEILLNEINFQYNVLLEQLISRNFD